MKCQRCAKSDAEYLCSVCSRMVCSNCKTVNNGKVYCLDHDPLKHFQNQGADKPKPQFKTLKEIIYADIILLIGVSVILFFSNMAISGMITSNLDVLMNNFPQLSFVFVLLQYFTSFGLYAIITLVIILVASISALIIKKHRAKNI